MRDLWVARHGATADSDAGVMNADLGRQRSLSEAGREQARAMAAVLAAEPIGICLTSEFARTVETAELAVAGRGIELRVMPALNEVQCGDEFEGRPYTEYFSWTVENGIFAKPPGAGSDCFVDTLFRIYHAWQEIIFRSEDSGLIVTHGLLVSFALRMLTLQSGQMLYPLPDAHPAGLHRLIANDVSRGLSQVPGLLLAAAQADEAGRHWAERFGPKVG